MNVPVQAQSVYRTQNVRAINGLSPSGDCGRGYFCCQGFTGDPFCAWCNPGPIGLCRQTAAEVCALHMAIPSHNC
jgi:hypothetical protein